MRRLVGLFFVGIAELMGGCASSRPPSAQVPAAASVPLPSTPTPTTLVSPTLSAKGAPFERPEWREHFAAEHAAGTIALLDTNDGKLSCSDVRLCQRPVIPASTFKIANSMIALETGVVDDAESPLPWDGKYYAVPEWNRNNTLRTAVQVSCVPCFQSIARNVGEPRMKEWLDRLDYGNKDSSGGVDLFWLTGGLRISPAQQVDFLRRFDQGLLPISKRTSETVRDLITLDVGRSHTLLGKTGMALPNDAGELAAWFVGWLELGDRKVYFATLINSCEAGIDPKPIRRAITERVLRAMALLPSDAARASSG